MNLSLFLFYIILISLGFGFYWKQYNNCLLAVSVIFLFTIPIIMAIEAVNCGYFFVVSDLCQSVNDAIYKDKFPVYNKGIGFLMNCNDLETRSAAFSLNYELAQVHKAYNDILLDPKADSKQFTLAIKMTDMIQEVKNNNLDPLLTCLPMYMSLVETEYSLCRHSSEISLNLFVNYFWVVLSVLLLSWGFNRMVPLIRRKIFEDQQRLLAEEVDY